MERAIELKKDTESETHYPGKNFDHQSVFVTSANFSLSAEQRNVELGLLLENLLLTQAIERQMHLMEDELVLAQLN